MRKRITRMASTAAGLLLLSCLQAAPARAAETVVYSEGFEASNGGFVLLEAPSNPALWQWGSVPATPGPGACHSGTKCMGTNLTGLMPKPTDGSIVSPAIVLPALDPSKSQVIRVRFWAFVSIDGMYDRGQFFVSKDKVNWESLAQLYNNMETSPSVTPKWHKYEFTIDNSYAGAPIYLRFRAAAQSTTSFYCGGSDDLSGFYVDDLAITYYDVSGDRKIFSMEAWEDPSAWASCPWVAPWNGSIFQADNDIYSVARMASGKYRDYYRLNVAPVAKNGVYPIEIQERETEDSYTDYVRLLQIDHAPGVAVAPDQGGTLHGYVPAQLIAPTSAVSGGSNVLQLVRTADDKGQGVYDGDTVEVNFGNVPNASQGATLVLRVAGFLDGQSTPRPFSGPPAVVVETRDQFGNWVERGRLLPRFAYSWGAYDITPHVGAGQNVQIRLRAISHDVKYHAIDYVALQAGAAPAFTVTEAAPSSASFGSQNILGSLLTADGIYVKTGTGEKFQMSFPVAPLASQNVREFVFVSEGYYEPKGGSYLVYTWDGTDWVQRDGTTYPGSDTLKSFDLSLFQPDPTGEYRVRIWQDYQYEPAGIDYVRMTVGGVLAPLNYAFDFRGGTSILAQLQASDNNRISWSYCPRNRVVEVHFTPPGPSNVPPTTNPVSVSNLGSTTPTISWAYNDPNGDTQAFAQVQVWTGPGATGTILWNPAVISGTGTSTVYNGAPLSVGPTYYARVQANDGKDWGAWSESAFTLTSSVCGDLNGDSLVNTTDYALFRSSLNKRVGQPGYIGAADYDGDGIVSLKDYATWYACYVKYR